MPSSEPVDEFGRDEHGPIHGYGCAECDVWCPRGGETHPLAWAKAHTRQRHDDNPETIVIVREESTVASWEAVS